MAAWSMSLSSNEDVTLWASEGMGPATAMAAAMRVTNTDVSFMMLGVYERETIRHSFSSDEMKGEKKTDRESDECEAKWKIKAKA